MSILQSGMTLVAGVVDDNDVVVGSDGLVMNRITGEPFVEQHIKSVRLNDRLCVAFSGDVYGASIVLSRLMGRQEWKGAVTICELWESSGQTVYYGNGIEGAAHIACTAIREIFADPSLKNVQKNGIAIMLAGKRGGKPHLWGCSQEEDDEDLKVLEGDSGNITLGTARPSSIEGQYKRLLACSTALADEAIVAAIRLVAQAVPKEVNGNVCIRRLTHQFRRDWRTAGLATYQD